MGEMLKSDQTVHGFLIRLAAHLNCGPQGKADGGAFGESEKLAPALGVELDAAHSGRLARFHARNRRGDGGRDAAGRATNPAIHVPSPIVSDIHKETMCYFQTGEPLEVTMYCPECGAEHRPGFSHCSDCLVPLVAERPLRTRGYATVLEDSDPAPIALAAELLHEAGIPFNLIQADCAVDGAAEEHEASRPFRLEVSPEVEVQAQAVLQDMETVELLDECENGPAHAPKPDLELVVVFEGDDRLVLSAARQELERAGIPFYVEGEELSVRLLPDLMYLHPWCRIQVGVDRQAEALQILRPFLSDKFNQEEGAQTTQSAQLPASGPTPGGGIGQ